MVFFLLLPQTSIHTKIQMHTTSHHPAFRVHHSPSETKRKKKKNVFKLFQWDFIVYSDFSLFPILRFRFVVRFYVTFIISTNERKKWMFFQTEKLFANKHTHTHTRYIKMHIQKEKKQYSYCIIITWNRMYLKKKTVSTFVLLCIFFKLLSSSPFYFLFVSHFRTHLNIGMA